MMHISTFFFYTEKLLTATFTLKYTLQIKKPKLKVALDKNHLMTMDNLQKGETMKYYSRLGLLYT